MNKYLTFQHIPPVTRFWDVSTGWGILRGLVYNGWKVSGTEPEKINWEGKRIFIFFLIVYLFKFLLSSWQKSSWTGSPFPTDFPLFCPMWSTTLDMLCSISLICMCSFRSPHTSECSSGNPTYPNNSKSNGINFTEERWGKKKWFEDPGKNLVKFHENKWNYSTFKIL